MYLECISCSQLGVSCDGPNFVAMSSKDLLEWCKQREKHIGMTREKLAELSGTPKGTIDRLFAGKSPDFKYETIRPMVKVLVGGSFAGNPCCSLRNGTESAPNIENEILKKDIEHAESMINEKDQRIRRYEKSLDWTMKELNISRKRERTLSLLCVAMGIFLTKYFKIDVANPDIGFILESHISPGAVAVIGTIVFAAWEIIAFCVQTIRNRKKDDK